MRNLIKDLDTIADIIDRDPAEARDALNDLIDRLRDQPRKRQRSK